MAQYSCLLLLLYIAGHIQASAAHKELVWLEDLNTNHDLRNVEIGLPSHLQFNIRRQDGNKVNLQLQENKRLNANAPVYVAGLENGKPTAREVDVPLVIGTKFYHDKKAGAAIKVSCADQPYGACQRVLEGSLNIDGDSYEIKPSPAALSFRGMGSLMTVQHTIEKVAQSPELQPGDRVHGLYGADYKYITDKPDVREELENKLRALLQKEKLEEKIQKLLVNKNRQKRAVGDLYAVEVVMVVDSKLWQKYYRITDANNGMDKDTATRYFLRERLAHIMNGVSLRYESIEDPAMDVYVTISQFLFYQTRSASSPLPSNVNTPNDEYADSDVYIDHLVDWVRSAPITAHDDHVMVITGYELYNGGNTSNNGVAGVAYVGGACGSYRVSVQEDLDYFVLTSVAAHELGHNLGADHDGVGSSSSCKAGDKNIMSPYVTTFRSGEKYSVNPWRFSECSVKAFKNYFGSGRCFKDHGDYYDKDEWDKHNEKLPGERFSPNEQCKLVRGDDSYMCGDAADEMICRVMTCYDSKSNLCFPFAAARGTPCGQSSLNKWCIDGKCIAKTVVAATTTPGTTETTTGVCVDIGYSVSSCEIISKYFYYLRFLKPKQWCTSPEWKYYCCDYCLRHGV